MDNDTQIVDAIATPQFIAQLQTATPELALKLVRFAMLRAVYQGQQDMLDKVEDILT